MRRSAAALAGPSLALAAAAACQCAVPPVTLFDCRSAAWDCAYCDRAGRCVLLLDGGLLEDAGQPDGGGGSCAPSMGERICSPAGACWEHPLPQGNDLHGLWGTASFGASASIWAVGSAGTILHWNGSAWSKVESGTREDLLSVWSDAPDEAWVTGTSGTWFKITLQGGVSPVSGAGSNDVADVWAEPGGSWIWAAGYGGKAYRVERSLALPAVPLTTGPATPLYAVFGVPGGATVWVAGSSGQLYGYEAATGAKLSTGAPLSYDLFDLWMPSSAELLVSASDGGVYSSNGTGAWTSQPLAPPLGDLPTAIWGNADSGELWVRGYDGLSYYRSPSRTWSSEPEPSRLNLHDVWGDAQAVWSVGEKGYIGQWDAGARWDARSAGLFPPRPQGADLLALQSLGCEAWAGGRNGQLLHRTGGGWSEQRRAPAAIAALWSPGPGEVWYGTGDAGRVERIIGGGNPTGSPTGLDGPVLGLSGLGPNAVWAVGEDGGASAWNGLGWSRQPTPERATLNAVLALAPDDVWAAGNAQTVLHFDGGAWGTAAAPSAGPDLRAIAASGSRVYFAGGTSLFTYDRSTGWTSRSDAPQPILALAVDAQGRVWAAGVAGSLSYVPSDGGAFQRVDALIAGDLHALSFQGGELLIAGDNNAILDVRPGP